MIDIILCIASSASLIIIFKLLDRFKLQFLPVITINYGVAVLCGILVCGQMPNFAEVLHTNWWGYALVLGFLFITVFLFTAQSTVHNGITVTAIAQKMSLVLTITAAFILYHDQVTLLKIVGIALAISAIVLTTRKSATNDDTKQEDKPLDLADKDKTAPSAMHTAALPLLVFFGSGTIDATINYVQKKHLDGVPFSDFIILLFGTAFVIGVIVVLVNVVRGKVAPTYKELLGGILLGIPNYFSMHFLMKSLSSSGMQSSVLYPVLNIGVVTTAALVAALVFKEKLSKVNIAGILLAIAAIAVLRWA